MWAALPFVLRGLAIASVAVAMARPQTVGGRTRVAGEGVAIVVALDQSSSMNAADFPDGDGRPPIARLDAARRTLARFIAGRPDDLVGLVVFANYPDLACPTTLDHEFLQDTVRSVRSARPGDDGTNLGDAMIVATEGLRESAPRKKVLILLTDGRSSTGLTWNCWIDWRSSAGAGRSSRPTRVPWTGSSPRSTPWRRARYAARSGPVIVNITPPWPPRRSGCF